MHSSSLSLSHVRNLGIVPSQQQPSSSNKQQPTTTTTTIINHLLARPYLTQSYYALRHGQSLANVDKIISSDPAVSTIQHGLSELGKEQAKLAGITFYQQYLAPSSSSSDNNDDEYEGIAIISSDFLRAKETASIFLQSLLLQSQQQQPSHHDNDDDYSSKKIQIYQNEIILNTQLRERYFGTLNGKSDRYYQNVWDVDCFNPSSSTEYHVECANHVLERTSKLIVELDDWLSSTSSSDNGDDDDDGTKQQANQINNNKKKKWKVILVAHGDVLQIMQTGFLRHVDASKHRSLEHLETATIRELKLTT
jgi:broad specificity phosphatase PhoE